MKTESIETLEKHLKLQVSLHGAHSLQVARVLCRLGQALIQNSHFTEAEEALRRALAIEKNVPHPDAAAIDQVQQLLDQVLSARTEINSSINLEWLKVSSDKVPAYTQAFDSGYNVEGGAPSEPSYTVKKNDPLEKAIADGKLEIARLRQMGGGDSIAVADALNKLAELYSRKEMHDEMEPLLKDALRIREEICGENHLSVSTDLKNLGRLYFYKNRYELAESFFIRAMSIREAALGPYHSYVADVAELYAKLLRKTNRDELAASVEELVTESRNKYGSDWEKLRNAGSKAMEAGNLLEAQAFWMAALEETSDFRFDDPRLTMTLESLSEVYWKRNKFDKAEPLCKQVLQISESILGPEHTDVALAANNLALVCEKQGKFAEAAILYQQALAVAEKFLGPNHPDVINIRESHSKARSQAHQVLEQKLKKEPGRWNKSGWWKAYQK